VPSPSSDLPGATAPEPGATSDRQLPPLVSRRVRLRRIAERDASFLYDLMTSPRAGGRVRYAGATPSPEAVAAGLWESVLAQFIVESTADHQPLGLAALTSPNFRDGFAYVSALGAMERRSLGRVAEGVLLTVNYGFRLWPFRKLYMEASEESLRAFSSGLGRLFEEEGRLRGHVFWNGRYQDVAILAVYRQVWEQTAPAVLERLGAAADG
jgi:hypothetical protein